MSLNGLEKKRKKFAEKLLDNIWNGYREWIEADFEKRKESSKASKFYAMHNSLNIVRECKMEEKVFPFGGYVRDHISGEPFNDIDLWINESFLLNKKTLVSYLRELGYTISVLKHESTYGAEELGSHKKINRTKIQIAKEDVMLEMDICSSPSSRTPFIHQDADVNSFSMHGKEIRYNVLDEADSTATFVATQYYRGGFYFNKAIQNIVNRRFEVLNPAKTSQYRIKKLLDKGYTKQGASCETETLKPVKEVMKMENTFMDMIKSDAEKAAYRVAATQMSNGVKKGLVRILQSKGMEGAKAEAAAEMLNTELGGAMVALLLGFGLKYAPMISEDPRAVKLSEEFRVKGMETVGNEVIGSLMEHLLPEVMNVLSSLPESKEKVRVNGAPAPEDEDEDEDASSASVVNKGKLSAVK